MSSGKWLKSPGGSFAYRVLGPVCRLYDREELPWPCCRLGWRTKEPSWNRVGKRFVADIAASRCPSYAVLAVDQWGNEWTQVLTLYNHRLNWVEKDWWITKKPQSKPFPELEASTGQKSLGEQA
jgi:hypothetical protein